MTKPAAPVTCLVRVEVATLWTSPDAPRTLDAAAIADEPDARGWAAGLDAETRMGLHGRVSSQLLRGEPVLVVEARAGWAKVAAPWQPDPDDPDGYVGWVRAAHLVEAPPSAPGAVLPPQPPPRIEPDRLVVVDAARHHLGLQYLWGGLSPYGLDCSGLVHHSYRQAGVVVPRDAHAQHAAATPVPLGHEQPGDLYFFARDGGYVFHVGFVTGAHRMLHAPETGGDGRIEEAELTPSRMATVVGAGRFLEMSPT